MNQANQPVLDVTDQEHFNQLCTQWSTKPLLALDTEFMRTNTFYPKPALIQVNDGEQTYLVDPTCVKSFAAFAEIWSDGKVRKVLHACSEDLEVFNLLLKALPINLLDTQIAGAFLGQGFSLGYSGLVESNLNIVLPKGETRSDWLQRPLTEAQRTYAALDVEYLFQIAEKFIRTLADNGRLGWVESESESLVQSFAEAQDLNNAAHRIRGAWRLNERQLALLNLLAPWRDRQAQERDVPRSYVVKDKALLQIAEIMPSHVAQLRKVAELPDKSIRRYGEDIIGLADIANQQAISDLPERLPRSPTSRQQNLIKVLREKIGTVAESCGIAPEYLARKKDYEFMVRAAEQGATGEKLIPPGCPAWRSELLQPIVTKYL